MSYAPIDDQIRDWAARHSLRLKTAWAGGECRSAYVSSVAGDCFQIWIDLPASGYVGVHATFVDGLRGDELHWDSRVPEADLTSALEQAFSKVTDWMKPSERYYPDPTDKWP